MPGDAEKHVAGVSVIIGGAPVNPKFMNVLTEVRVRDTLALPASAVVRFTDPEGDLVDDALFEIGKPLEIQAGEPNSTTLSSIFKGEIVAFEPEFQKDGVDIVIRGYDKAHRLQRERRVRTFQQVTASDVVSKIVREAGLAVGQVESTSEVYEFFQQSAETDWELITRLARDHGHRFYMDGDRCAFKKAASASGTPVPLKWQETLISFRPRISAAQQVNSVEVRAWDIQAKKAIVGTGSNGSSSSESGIQRSSVANKYPGTGKTLVADRAAESQAQATKLAKSGLDGRADAYVEAEGVALGNPKIQAGCQVKVDGVGTKLAGTYYVTAVTHLYRGKKGYQTSFQISGRSERGLLDLMHPPEKRDWGRNLVVGIVTNNKDEKKLGRIRVKYPSLSDSEESAWARVLTPHAGKGRGIFMMPQVNDEVVVAFENGDTRRPLVIGSVFNGKDTPAPEHLHEKDGKTGSFAVASDEEAIVHSKKDLTLKSDQQLIIEVQKDRKETNSGKVEQDFKSSVKLKSGSSYEVEAGASIKIKGASINVEAQGQLSLKGATVSIEASTGPATLKGMTVDVQGSTATNIKGAIVNIG